MSKLLILENGVPGTPATQAAPGVWKMKTVYELRVQGDWLGS